MLSKIVFKFSALLWLGICLQGAESLRCPDGFTAHFRMCYAVVRTRMSWPDASATCLAMNAFLAEPKSEEENSYIKSLLSYDTWIGGSDLIQEGVWYYAHSRTRINSFSDWVSGEPSNDNGAEHCLEMRWNVHYKWNDRGCTDALHFVCQSHSTA